MTMFADAAVTSVSPLLVLFDGDVTPWPADTMVAVSTLTVADRVRCELSQGRLIVHGRAGGVVIPDASTTVKGISELATTAEVLAGTDTTRAVTPAGLAAARALPVQGVIPSSIVVGSGSATVADNGTITFTGCSSVSLNGIFDGLGADLYEIWIFYLGSVDSTNLFARLRNAGVDYSGASAYRNNLFYNSNGGTPTGAVTTNNYIWSSYTRSTGRALAINRVSGPKRSGIATLISTQISSPAYVTGMSTVDETTASVSDGYKIYPASGTITGEMKVVKIA